jgi:hypothetical protein
MARGARKDTADEVGEDDNGRPSEEGRFESMGEGPLAADGGQNGSERAGPARSAGDGRGV